MQAEIKELITEYITKSVLLEPDTPELRIKIINDIKAVDSVKDVIISNDITLKKIKVVDTMGRSVEWSMGVMQEYDTISAELARWKTGDWCEQCNQPQWVRVDGSHNCDDIPNLQYNISDLENQLATKQRECDEWEWKYEELQKQMSFFHSTVNDIATALGWKAGQTYDAESMVKKIERLKAAKYIPVSLEQSRHILREIDIINDVIRNTDGGTYGNVTEQLREAIERGLNNWNKR